MARDRGTGRTSVTEGFRVSTSPRVLVIDGQPDTEAVLKAVLEPRGARVDWSRQTAAAPSTQPEAPPHVVVIDLDDQPRNSRIDGTKASGGRILIGSHRVTMGRSNDLFLEKPFQFPELISAIEGLLATPVEQA